MHKMRLGTYKKNIYFVRHGESETNKDKIYRGSAAQLTKKGEEQAILISKRAKKLPFDVIITSSYPRALKTAEVIRGSVNKAMEISDLFVERKRPSEIIGTHIDDLERKKIENEITKNFKNTDYHYSDEENFSDLQNRADKAIEYLKNKKEENMLVVTHGVFLRVLIMRMFLGDGFTSEIALRSNNFLRTYNAGITHVGFQDNEWRLYQWNDSAHLG